MASSNPLDPCSCQFHTVPTCRSVKPRRRRAPPAGAALQSTLFPCPWLLGRMGESCKIHLTDEKSKAQSSDPPFEVTQKSAAEPQRGLRATLVYTLLGGGGHQGLGLGRRDAGAVGTSPPLVGH